MTQNGTVTPAGISPGPRQNLMVPFALYGLALTVRLLFASSLPFPSLDDPPFYMTVASNLAQGRGLVIDAIWTYLVPFESVTHASNEFWMPLPALVLAPFFAVFGPDLFVAQAFGAVVGASLAPLTWYTARVAARAGGGGWQGLALISGALVAVNPLLSYQATNADSSVYFSVLGAVALLVGIKGDRLGYAMGAGLLTGLAYLARSEGVLIALLLAGYLLVARRAPRGAGLLLLGVALVAALWLVRNTLTFGVPVPAPASTLATLDAYGGLFRYGLEAAPIDIPQQVALRVEALQHNLGLILLQALFPIAPLAIAGFPPMRTAPVVAAGTAALVVLLFGTALLFPVPTIHGTFYHAVGAVLPLMTVLAVQGLARLGVNVGRALFGHPASVPTIFGGAAVLLSCVQLGDALAVTTEQHTRWRDQFQVAAAWLLDHPEGPVMTNEPHTLLYATGRPALMLPWGSPPEAAREAARRYGARYLIGFDRFGEYPAALEAAPGFTRLFEDRGVWAYQVQP